MAFAAFPLDLGEIDEQNLDIVELGEAENVIIAGAGHPLAKRKTVSADELMAHPFVRYQTGSGCRRVTDQYFLSGNGYPPILLESNDTEFIKRMVGLGLGVAMVPAFTVASGGRDRRLRILRLPDAKVTQALRHGSPPWQPQPGGQIVSRLLHCPSLRASWRGSVRRADR